MWQFFREPVLVASNAVAAVVAARNANVLRSRR
jgi:hypothetical protein